MGEGTSAMWLSGNSGRQRGSDKDRSRRLAILPPVATAALWQVAGQCHQHALVLLLTKYFLRPEQLVSARLEDEGLMVAGFTRPLRLDPADREVLAEWLSRPRRPRSAQAVYNVVSKTLRPALVKALTEHNRATGQVPDWDRLLDLGVGTLRQMARECHGEAAGYEEATYRELLHEEDADPDETLRSLSTRSRRILANAAASVVAEIETARQRLEFER